MSLLVLSFSFTSWNVRSDEWATAMFLTYLYPQSLLPVSLYSLCTTATGLLFGSSIGTLVDNVPRLFMVLSALLIQKICIVGITIVIWSCVDFQLELIPVTEDMGWQFALIVVLGAILRIANMISTIAIERDWPRHIEHDTQALSKLNANLRGVDLVSKLAAPLFVSLIFSFTTVPITILAMGSMSTLTTIIEWTCLIKVYKSNVGLHRQGHRLSTSESEEPSPVGQESEPEEHTSGDEEDALLTEEIIFEKPGFIADLKKAISHDEFITCVCVAMLYFNVLSFGPVMVSYLLQLGVHPLLIAVFRGVGVGMGIGATLTYPFFAKLVGLSRAGLWSISFELIFLGLACSSFLVTDQFWSVTIFLIGVNISRYGLYSYDLAQTQLIQEGADDEIGALTGIQMSMQSFFDLLAFGSTAIWSSTDQFWIPSLLSFGAVFFALILYTWYIFKKRGHLFHWEKFQRNI
jgi:solute carrier family 40 (iron-regulated transporter), member 1